MELAFFAATTHWVDPSIELSSSIPSSDPSQKAQMGRRGLKWWTGPWFMMLTSWFQILPLLTWGYASLSSTLSLDLKSKNGVEQKENCGGKKIIWGLEHFWCSHTLFMLLSFSVLRMKSSNNGKQEGWGVHSPNNLLPETSASADFMGGLALGQAYLSDDTGCPSFCHSTLEKGKLPALQRRRILCPKPASTAEESDPSNITLKDTR